MLRSLRSLSNYELIATDGPVGKAVDFLFDDRSWTTRYAVAETGSWLSSRHVLVSPRRLGLPDFHDATLPIAMSRIEVQSCPPLAADRPVSLRHDVIPLNAYSFAALPLQHRTEEGDPHLRSADEVTGYDVEARDGEIGHVEDFILDVGSWKIRDFVIDTRNWLPGKKVRVAPEHAHRVDWSARKVYFDLTRSQIDRSRVFDPTEPVNRETEERLYDVHGMPQYRVGVPGPVSGHES